VTEGEGFDVVVSVDGMLIEGATVEFNDLRQITHENGLVRFIAPFVSENTEYLVRATMQGYIAANRNITVMNQETEEPLGYISGTVTNTSGFTVEGATVCANLVGEIDTNCIETNERGEYTLVVLPGVYTVTASKQGYEDESVSSVTVTDDSETIVNIVLTPVLPPTSPEQEIADAIEEGMIGGEVIINKTGNQTHVNTTIYGNITITSFVGDNTITFSVDGKSQIGQTLIFRIDPQIVDLNERFTVTYDGNLIDPATNFTDILNPTNDGVHVEYYVLVSDQEKVLFVSVSSFSAHTITISSVVEALSTLTIIGLYVLFAVLIGVLLVSPALASGVYHTFKRKKNKREK
jgi:hypothetical protein